MREAVIIKSFPNGIALYLNEELPFEKVLEEIGYKFGQARNFFGEAIMALSIEGRAVSNVDEIRILETIHENSDLHIICIVSRDEEANKNYIKALAHTEKKLASEEGGQFFRGDSYVAALEMEPERIKIGDCKYKPKTKQAKWGIHPKIRPKIAYIKNDRIVFEAFTKDLLDTFG